MKSLKDKFKYALRGVSLCFKDPSICIQFIFMIVAIAMAFLLKFNMFEFMIVLLCCCIVITLEIINTCIEKIMDFIQIDYHEKVRDIKDMAAGFVFIGSIFVLIIGILLYGSKLLMLL